MNRKCLLKVKELVLINTDLEDVTLKWRFNKKEGVLDVSVEKTPNQTMKCSATKITEATRDYGKWM